MHKPACRGIAVLLVAALAGAAGCGEESSPTSTGPPSGSEVPDFAVRDVNPNSVRFDELVSPRDYKGHVSAWYFGHATWSYCRSQFGFLDTIRAELDAENLPVHVRILGINPDGFESGNAAMCDGRSLPWLQETANDDVWGDWKVAYRDVVILDADNLPVGIFNLTTHDLSTIANRDALKQKLREAGSP